MGVFGFIEHFFFISLGIVFGLVLLLVYHFKKRMSVAEKKSESMYGLLSTVVKEIRNIRSTFGLSATSATATATTAATTGPSVSHHQLSDNKPKSEPEISVSVKPSAAAAANKEIITLELAASEVPVAATHSGKIVVSEDEDEDESDDSDGIESDDYESDDSYESESESDDEVENIVLEPIHPHMNIVETELELEDFDVVVPLPKTSLDHVPLDNIDIVAIETLEDNVEPAEPKSTEDVAEENSAIVVEEEAKISEPKTDKPSIENLRKMNINQLRTIAIQQGISADTGKMKKNELINLMQSRFLE